MARTAAKETKADLEYRLTRLHTDYLAIKAKNTKLIAYLHANGHDVKEILREVEVDKEMELF